VYGEVPPLKVADRVDDCVALIGDGKADEALTVRAGLTVTVSPAEHTDEREDAESVTLYEYVVVDFGEGEYVDDVAPDMSVLQLDPVYHL
jgi:hypothetical protein